MQRRTIFAAVALAALTVAVSTASATVNGRDGAAANSITVWLQVDAQSGWPEAVAAATTQFQKDHPGVSVNVQYQTWGDHLQKFDASLAGSGGPDVIEMGNTEMSKYMIAGGFATLNKGSFQNSSSWLKGLAAQGQYGGKLYGVPYYAGSRVVTYRTDLFRRAGAKSAPTSLSQFSAIARKIGRLNNPHGFSPVYIAGEDWYVAMSFVYDYGGQIAATAKGKWGGTLAGPKAIAGLTAYKNFFSAASRASKTTDEAHPNPYDVYARGGAASMIGQSWFTCCVGDKYKALTKQFVMPSHEKGKSMPGFLGGSLLAVPVTSSDKSLAADWIKNFTDTGSEKVFQAKGNIPNATNLLGNSVNERAAVRSWFVPSAKHWGDVENANVLRNMLAQILTGKRSVKQAATAASKSITSILNRP